MVRVEYLHIWKIADVFCRYILAISLRYIYAILPSDNYMYQITHYIYIHTIYIYTHTHIDMSHPSNQPTLDIYECDYWMSGWIVISPPCMNASFNLTTRCVNCWALSRHLPYTSFVNKSLDCVVLGD